MARWSPKDPNDIADYWFNFGPDPDDTSVKPFLPEDETITTATVSVPAGVTKVSESNTDKMVRVRLSGGTDGEDYPIDCLMNTSDGQTFEQTQVLKVRNRIK